MNERDARRERIFQFYLENCTLGNKATVEHFLAEGVPRSTIYDIIQRARDNIPPERQSGQGRKAEKMPKARVKRLQAHFDHRDGRSTRQAAEVFDISQTYVRKLLGTRGIKCRKKKTTPDRTEIQARAAKTKCRNLYEKYRNREWILDDESYFTLSHSTMAGNDIYYSSDVGLTPANVKLRKKSKYEKKILVWVAISKKGMSAVFTQPSGLAINQNIYREQCLQRRLIPFIQKYHPQDETLFWPDLASSHYAKTVVDFMNNENITFVEKRENPANLPECRPIELFWAILKRKVYAKGWKAKTLPQLKTRILNCIKKISTNTLEELFSGMLRKIRDVGRNGVVENN